MDLNLSKTFITLCLIVAACLGGSAGIDLSTYLSQRNDLLQQDFSRMTGQDSNMTTEENDVNTILMSLKDAEVQNGLDNLVFPPSTSFFISKDQIDQSEVFSMIKDMPKGAALHLHDTGLASMDWVISNLTYLPDLYMCNVTSPIIFRFFDTPDASCLNWELVSDARAAAASPQEFDDLLLQTLSIITDNPDDYPDINKVWETLDNCFISIEGLVTEKAAWEAYLERLLYEFMMDNVMYIEFRGVLPALYEKNGTTYSQMQSFESYERVINNFVATNSDFFGAKFIYAPLKPADAANMAEEVAFVKQLKSAYPDLVAGFDLVGQEDVNNPLKSYINDLLDLEADGIPVFYHAGETNWHGTDSDENLFDAVLLNSTRIGHGYAIVKHPELLEMGRNKNIAMEVCPISNQVLMLVEDLRNHPMAALASDGYPLVVSSDDPAMWGALPLSHDFYEAFYALGGAKADLRFLRQLALNSIEFSSLGAIEKQSLQNQWQNKWDAYISGTIQKYNVKTQK